MSDLTNRILKRLKGDLTEAFDRNFEDKRFFNESQKWVKTIRRVPRGSLLVRTSAMRNSIKSSIQGESLVYTSSKPYTAIHNDGGTINIPARKQVIHFSKKGRFSKNNKKAKYAQKANVRAYKVTIPKRRFIGDAPEVNKIIKEVIDVHVNEAINEAVNNNNKNG